MDRPRVRAALRTRVALIVELERPRSLEDAPAACPELPVGPLRFASRDSTTSIASSQRSPPFRLEGTSRGRIDTVDETVSTASPCRCRRYS
ncbi:hypothetical protein EL22_04180 [Halostagnicola sp. A56]|nr:hypothetical protein EL22_04180 [Halostagnicola sp. A56]